ncbi:MAG TPA: CapA family protein [Solirubrobacteraceae bacterium]|nr:CapA family protein [Solirubrobacteraceae bacterium]
MTRRLLIVTASGLVALTAACSAGAPAQHAAGASADRASPIVKHRHPVVASGEITLAFAGDVHFAGRVARLLKDPATTFGPITSVLKSADFTAVNLETPVTNRGQPQLKTYHFTATPGAFTALRDARVDLVTMANNHILDYGQTGLADTLAAAKAAHFPYVGAGVNAAAAWAPYVTTINGTKIAIVGVSQVAELASSWVATAHRPGEANAIDLGQTLAAVQAAKRLARIVIVFMHWGTEGMACPDQNQLSLAPKLAAAGASIIIGAHAHMLQGSGWLGHTFVAYGMGNFLWWENSYSTATGVLKLTLHPHALLTARFIPALVSGTGQSIVDQGAAARRALAHYASLRTCAGLSASPPAGAITPTSAG